MLQFLFLRDVLLRVNVIPPSSCSSFLKLPLFLDELFIELPVKHYYFIIKFNVTFPNFSKCILGVFCGIAFSWVEYKKWTVVGNDYILKSVSEILLLINFV